MEADEDPFIQAQRKVRRGDADFGGTLALRAVERIGHRLEGRERLDATAADPPARTVLDVIIGEAEVEDVGTDVRRGNDVELVGTGGLVGGNETIDANEVAALKKTVSYDVLTNWRHRLRRVYVEGSSRA